MSTTIIDNKYFIPKSDQYFIQNIKYFQFHPLEPLCITDDWVYDIIRDIDPEFKPRQFDNSDYQCGEGGNCDGCRREEEYYESSEYAEYGWATEIFGFEVNDPEFRNKLMNMFIFE